MSERLDEALKKIEQSNDILTGGGNPEHGICFRMKMLETNVQTFQIADRKMHSQINRWLLAITLILTYRLMTDPLSKLNMLHLLKLFGF